MHLEVAPVIKGLHFWQAFNNGVLWWPELPPSAFVAFNLQKNDLSKTCLLLVTLLALSGAVWVIGQEDCLMMNIYSPNLTPETPLPVMVWKKKRKKRKSFNLRFCIARSGSMVGVLLLEAILPLSMEHPTTETGIQCFLFYARIKTLPQRCFVGFHKLQARSTGLP